MTKQPHSAECDREEVAELLAVDPRDIMSQGYGLAPQMLFRDERLSAHAKAIYGYLASFAGAGPTAYPSKELMCKELGMSRPTFDKHLKSLEAYGYVRVHRRRSATGQHLCNVYELLRAPAIDRERMEAFTRHCVKATARSRAQYRARKEAALSEADVLRAAEEIVAAMFGIELSLGAEGAGSGEACCEDGAGPDVENPSVPEIEPVSNSFTLGESARSEPVINSFTLDGPVSNSSPSPVSNSFTPISNRGKITVDQSIPEVDPPVGGGLVENFAQREGAGIGPEAAAFAQLVASSIKPVRGGVRQLAWGLWEEKLGDGYGPDDVLAAYEAYRKAYFRHNSTVKYAKRLDRWLSDADGLDAYARIAEVGPYNWSASAAALDEAVRREMGRRVDTESLSDALAAVDETYRAMREAASRAQARAVESRDSGDWAVHGELADRAMLYLIKNDKRARAALSARVRARLSESGPCGAEGPRQATEERAEAEVM